MAAVPGHRRRRPTASAPPGASGAALTIGAQKIYPAKRRAVTAAQRGVSNVARLSQP